MKFFLIVLLLAGALCGRVAAAETPPGKPQIILLKLDDVVARQTGSSPVSPRWQRIADYFKSTSIKGSFGIICESLEKDNAAYFQWIKNIEQAGMIEFWLHGYHLKKADEPGEFEQGTAGEQQAIFDKSERLAKEKLGFSLTAFGPHWSGTTEATDQALEAVPEIKIWLYGPAKPKHFSRLSIERVLALENHVRTRCDEVQSRLRKVRREPRGVGSARTPRPMER